MLKVRLDMDDLTFGDLERFEDATGLVMADAVRTVVVKGPDGRPLPDPDDPKGRPLREVQMSARAMNGMVWIAMRRENPEITFNDVREMRMSDVDFDMQASDPDEGTEPDPTPPVTDGE